MNDDLLSRVERCCSSLFEERGFRLIRNELAAFNGIARVVIASNAFWLSFDTDRGCTTGAISANGSDDEWFDISLVRFHVCGGDMLGALDLEEIPNFVDSNYAALATLFKTSNSDATAAILRRLQKIRVRKMFPQLADQSDDELFGPESGE